MKLDALKDLAHFSLKIAEHSGAEYAEARIQTEKGHGFMLKNGEPQPAVIDDSLGIGIRILHGGALAFSATNLMSKDSVRELTRRTVKLAKGSMDIVKDPVTLAEAKPLKKKFSAPEQRRIEGASGQWLRSLLDEIDKRVKKVRGAKIPNRILGASAGFEEKYFANTDGGQAESRVPRIHFYGVLTAISEGRIAQRTIQHGESGGLEVVKRLDLVDKVEAEARTLAKVVTTAKKSPTGVTDVVLGPELSGIAAHESVGHPQEADRILGREGAQAGESYLKRDSLGQKIGSEEANISDDPTLVHSNGYSPIDDECVEGVKRILIKDGRITTFLHNRTTAAQLNAPNNGSARASSFDREPIVRMSNTFVEPGDYTFEELLREVDDGVYLKSFTEWNIDDKRLNQRYVGLEAYHIVKGELDELVNAPVLEINTPALWKSVKARSNRLEFEAAVCGKGDPMQGIPVWTGGPDTLLKGVRLGSR